uniref:Heterochromatin protein 1-like protein 2 n=1 Tax=Schmidtea mediterranea TaxID=79327 RepID=M9NNX2_SCHMD|nr:heterochromatin protein 1-like protein 2 [Schmidtea mediterranea]
MSEVIEVEKIIAVSNRNGKRCYLLKWKNYDSSLNSWEPEEHLNCGALIKNFHKNLKLKEFTQNFQLPMTIKVPIIKDHAYGFDRGLKPQIICGVTKKNDAIYFMIKWDGCDEIDVVPAVQANVKCPQLVIRFYENNFSFEE